MLKKILSAIVLLFICVTVNAQTTEQVLNKYLDFNVARLQGDAAQALSLGEQILPDTAKLSPKARVAFYNGIAKLYEDDNQSVKAIEFYQKVVAAQPNYYVAHRALGFLYIKDIITNTPGTPKIDVNYINNAKKALPHLEKDQACDPDDVTLALIKTLYKNIKDNSGLRSLNSRLKVMKGNCVDIVSDN